ncbi:MULTISPECIES: hypothetical protein [unclassified Paenibacillus]|uniref:hypothetical protein n=1 Tax=unclassified Paenibacillus TaxID=185978 RepID=UPI000895FE58|nr:MULTISPECIES: hypothetical protein [unclassified Paenibacillus]OMC68614.1 hypothetical protein BK126_12360 [Paenibacillus sp. FSL H7-0326]SDW57200.1 hypothetical protein SAMN05518848_102221 [Paenibacillus sp. PDC88]
MINDKVKAISEQFMVQDARKLPEGNWFTAKTYFMSGYKSRSFTPIHVFLKDTGLRLYFWFDGDFHEWFKKYVVVTGDIEGDGFELYEMYSESRVKELNAHKDSPSPNLGDRIVENGYTYSLGNRKFHFVQRYATIKVNVTWRKGGF